MTPTVIKGRIKNGKIIPLVNLPSSFSNLEVTIVVFKNKNQTHERAKYRSNIVKGWGDPLKYQREKRKELER